MLNADEPRAGAAGAPFVVRPLPFREVATLTRGGWLILAFIALGFVLLAASGQVGRQVATIFVFWMTLLTAFAVWNRRRLGFELDDAGVITCHGRLRGRRVISTPSSPGYVIAFEIRPRRAEPRTWQLWMNAHGECVVGVPERIWGVDRLTELRERARLDLEHGPEMGTLKEAIAVYPGLAPKRDPRVRFAVGLVFLVLGFSSALAGAALFPEHVVHCGCEQQQVR